MEPKTSSMMAPTKAAKSRMMVRQPTGTNHFQLRDHQLGRCCGGKPGGGRLVGVAKRNFLDQRTERAAVFLVSSMLRTVRASTSEENGFCRKAAPGISCCNILSSV